MDDWYLLSIVPENAIRVEGDRMLRDTRMALGLVGVALVFCTVFILLIWRTHKDMEEKDKEVKYQTQLFRIFTTYLSRNTKTGERKYFVENAYCVDVQGRIKRVSYISDRTKERRAQNDLTEALWMARTANDAKSAFLSSVSHDIRTPMNAIIGFLALMRHEANHPEVVLEYTQRIDAASQHLLGLINDVLDMNKIERGSATLNISEMNLADLIEEIHTIIRPQTAHQPDTDQSVV